MTTTLPDHVEFQCAVCGGSEILRLRDPEASAVVYEWENPLHNCTSLRVPPSGKWICPHDHVTVYKLGEECYWCRKCDPNWDTKDSPIWRDDDIRPVADIAADTHLPAQVDLVCPECDHTGWLVLLDAENGEYRWMNQHHKRCEAGTITSSTERHCPNGHMSVYDIGDDLYWCEDCIRYTEEFPVYEEYMLKDSEEITGEELGRYIENQLETIEDDCDDEE